MFKSRESGASFIATRDGDNVALLVPTVGVDGCRPSIYEVGGVVARSTDEAVVTSFASSSAIKSTNVKFARMVYAFETRKQLFRFLPDVVRPMHGFLKLSGSLQV